MNKVDGTAFKQAFGRLNQKQRQAVEQTDGPLLVVAGPGTGKTQLLSARVAYILESTDTLPQNILCLTFTESGATNMRERLSRFIGQAAYDVTIGTYHAFGGDLIGRFPQYFGDHREQQPVDSLGQREIVQAIVDAMAFSNPLKSSQHHLHDLMSTISEVKRGLLTEESLRAIAHDNMLFLADVNSEIKEVFADLARMPSKLDKALPYFQNLYNFLQSRDQEDYTIGNNIKPLANVLAFELGQTIAEAVDSNSTKPLTAWKNKWLTKDQDNNFICDGLRENQRIEALADVFRQYSEQLSERGLYDFDDMILRSITALETHSDLRFTLQEQYQYIMLDEFQDTNAAQLKLIKLLTNNPVYEGRPNVMAVGDDDQAIYAFQGAEVSNMLEFAEMYNGTAVINLTDNYRSHPEILHVAHEVAQQITTRLESNFQDMSKILVAANKDIASQAHIDRHEFLADVGQYDWIAHQIADLIQSGVKAQEIAVLAPRHKQLEPLVGYLNQLAIPVRYEKRENILQAPVVQQLLTMSKLVLALRDGQNELADSLWPEVLSYNFWGLATSAIWQLSWQVRGSSGELSWSRAILNDEQFAIPGLLLLSLAKIAASESLEVMLDALIGNEIIDTGEASTPQVQSPLREFYMGQAEQTEGPDLFYQTLSHITCLREKLRDHQNSRGEEPLKLDDLLSFVGLYEAAEERMLNTSPYNQHAEAVQLMTVFKSKGLEFEHVFLPSVQDEVWGNSSRGSANRLTLPPNLAPIRPAGTTEDERLRIFFVAVTRAKLGLHLTSFLQTYSGRNTKRLKYLNEVESSDGFKAMILPAERQDVRRVEQEVPELSTLELNWRQRHFESLDITSLRDLLEEKIQDFKLSPTQIGHFTDTIYGGPQAFFFDNLLHFPHASGESAQFGNSIHETLQWVQQQVDANDTLPIREATMQYYEIRLRAKHLRVDHLAQYIERGKHALDEYIGQHGAIFKRGNRAEYGFRNENVVVGEARLSGKIDLMEIDQQNRTITVVDYKTGKSYERWVSDPKLHKYKQQLICYKLLIENSRTYKGYRVNIGRLEFVEPDDNGKIHSLSLQFDDKDVAETTALLQAVWRCVQELHFPDISDYDQTLAGIKEFEASLLEKSEEKN
jgi:DNA helicase-2/ATP-dependent DNA helicase PcrA